MRRSPRLLAVGCALFLVSGAARAASVTVEVEGIEPGGLLSVALCQDGLSEADCRTGQQAPPRAAAQRFVFQNVAPGIYAAVAYQDTNGNGRLDRTGLGLPLEPYGFSGDSARSARPDFARARFTVREPGVGVRVRLSRALPPR
ncbi:hypothetical protein ASF49_17995 [Methylobacterium sp. Leaf104]|uniref:DUF2141 domain-containing protein n=1 Tax=Methylobacterium TaxID=407 RepID=UPI0006F7F4E4|nr:MULTISPECIES: DUF2141 domain-containing protein [Methylobacterium]KQP41259.1 hypothetical protein ASF49_17995 [Methylobacterium sp. Leaf104]